MLSQYLPADRPYAFAFIVLYSLLMIIRVIFRLSHHDLGRRLINRDEGIGNIIARWALGSLLIAAIALYFAAPEETPWFYLPVPTMIRVLAVGVSAASIGLLVWAHVALNSQFSSTLRVGAGHRLVTHGPYRLIQHPIYAAFFLLFLATGLFTRSWPIGLLGMLTIGTLMTTRRVREEAMLRARYGENYDRYQARTGRFVPRFSRGALPTAAQSGDQQ